MPSLEEKWLEIAEEAIKKAEKVKCASDEFVAGLELIAREINDRAACG